MEKIKVNQEACIGCGACTAICSDIFSFNDEGFAYSNEEKNILDTMNEDVKCDAIDALEGCPTSAIYKEEI